MRARARRGDRRFTRIDAFLALAAVLIGSAGAIAVSPLAAMAFAPLALMYDWTYRLRVLLSVVRWSLFPVAAFVAPATVALLVMRLSRPRPPLSRCFRQPGAAGCAVATVALIADAVNHFLNLPIRLELMGRLRVQFHFWDSTRDLHFPVGELAGRLALSIGTFPGLAVAGSYLALWASGLWRPEPTWIDRSGRALGWIWICVALGWIALPIR